MDALTHAMHIAMEVALIHVLVDAEQLVLHVLEDALAHVTQAVVVHASLIVKEHVLTDVKSVVLTIVLVIVRVLQYKHPRVRTITHQRRTIPHQHRTIHQVVTVHVLVNVLHTVDMDVLGDVMGIAQTHVQGHVRHIVIMVARVDVNELVQQPVQICVLIDALAIQDKKYNDYPQKS